MKKPINWSAMFQVIDLEKEKADFLAKELKARRLAKHVLAKHFAEMAAKVQQQINRERREI